MEPHTIPVNNKAARPYKPPANCDSYLGATAGNNDLSTAWAASKALKGRSGQFALVLAHEVRNPLTTIKLSVKMLESAIKSDELKIYLDIITRSSMHINSLINELVKYQESDEVRAEKQSIPSLLDEVLEMAGDRITLKNIAVRKDYAGQDCEIILDGHKMKIALTNIIINAIDAMTSDKRELTLITKSLDDKYTLEIRDNGCGISKENLKHIFRPYFSNKPGGLGLGLSATRDILKSNHVGVCVESEVGQGTSFILSFNKNHPYNLFH